MTTHARLMMLAALMLPGTAGWAQGGRATRALPSFRSERALSEYLHQVATQQSEQLSVVANCSSNMRTARYERVTRGPAVIVGRVTNPSGEAIANASVEINSLAVTTATSKEGRYRLRIPADSLPAARRLMMKVRMIGYGQVAHSLEMGPRDSLEFDVSLCPASTQLAGVAVSGTITIDGGALYRAEGEAITNTQHAGVDEGGIVKLHGDHLVILRRGRLFTVAIGGDDLKPIATVDAFGPGIDPQYAWYDELLVSGDRVVVIGYSYERGGTELGVFDIDAAGGLRHRGTYQLRSNDYYSARNYASRLIGHRLVYYTPLYLPYGLDEPLSVLPSMRRWIPRAGVDSGRFERIVTPQRVYHPAGWSASGGAGVALHTVTVCDLAAELSCEATVVIGPAGRVFYVAPEAVYVWMSDWTRYPRHVGTAILCRMPLDGSAPSAVGATGSPVDQFSFLESEDGHVNVLVRSDAWGDAMWAPEWAAGNASLLRLPLATFGDGSQAATANMYRRLPTETGGTFHNRFVGDFLLYGNGSGWGWPAADGSILYVVPWKGGGVTRLVLPHGTDRIEPMGQDAVIVGADKRDLHFTGIRLAGTPEVAQRYTLRQASQGELRSHGFFYKPDGDHSGVLGLPVRGLGRPGYEHLFDGSASILFLRNHNWRFDPLGTLEADGEGTKDDACKASCVDWYGNARPLFIRGRIFALLGYELVEGSVQQGKIVAVRRASFAPPAVRAARH